MIWSSIIHFSDTSFVDDGLDVHLAMTLAEKTKQTWLVNPLYKKNKSLEYFLRHSYEKIRNSKESYLVLFTPTMQDVSSWSSGPLFYFRCLRLLSDTCKVFNKRFVVTTVLEHGIDEERYNKSLIYNIKNNSDDFIKLSGGLESSSIELISDGIINLHSGE